LKLFLGPLASELKTKMVEDQHKLNGAAEEEKDEKEEEEEVMNNEAATRSIIVASEAAHQIEPLTILAAVEPASSSTTTTTTTTTTQVVQITPASPNPKAITTPRAKVPLEKGYSQMVWLKLLRTEPDLAGSHSPLSLKCNFSLSFTPSHYIEVCSESLHLITAILTFVVNSFTRVTYDCTQLLSYLQSL
jgi:hypothetical protein